MRTPFRIIASLIFISSLALAQEVKVQQHMMLIEPTGTELNVNETMILEGSGTGKVQVAIPPEAGTPTVRNGTIAKTRTPGVFEITVPDLGPQTRVDFAWLIPFLVPETLKGRVLHRDGLVRFVFPKGVKASGPMLESNGVEPTTQASIFTLKGTSYAIEIDGAGTLRAARPPQESAEEGPTLDQIMPRLYSRKYEILGLTLAILAIGFALNYRASVKN